MRRLGMPRMLAVAAVVVAAALVLVAPASSSGVSCGSTIVTDETLSADLSACADGLIVSDGVTLDLGGHTLSGVGGGVGVELAGGATVENGTVSGFGLGIDKLGFGDVTLEHLTISNNNIGINLGGPGHFAIRHNVVSNNGDGISLFADFLRPYGEISDNRVAFNQGDGIDNSTKVEPVAYEGNNVSNNGEYGIFVIEATSTFVANTFRHNGATGLYVFDSYGIFFPYWFSGNTADSNGGAGIAFSGVLSSGSMTVDGGGNSAKHNADPSQCVGITCAYNQGLATKAPQNEGVGLHG